MQINYQVAFNSMRDGPHM